MKPGLWPVACGQGGRAGATTFAQPGPLCRPRFSAPHQAALPELRDEPTVNPAWRKRCPPRPPVPQPHQGGASHQLHCLPPKVPFAPAWHSWAPESRPHPPLLACWGGGRGAGEGSVPVPVPTGCGWEAGTMASFFSLGGRGWGNPRAGGGQGVVLSHPAWPGPCLSAPCPHRYSRGDLRGLASHLWTPETKSQTAPTWP